MPYLLNKSNKYIPFNVILYLGFDREDDAQKIPDKFLPDKTCDLMTVRI